MKGRSMSLSCSLPCAFCGFQIPIRRPLRPGQRYNTCCTRCGARIGFGPKHLRWRYEPAASRRPSLPGLPVLTGDLSVASAG